MHKNIHEKLTWQNIFVSVAFLVHLLLSVRAWHLQVLRLILLQLLTSATHQASRMAVIKQTGSNGRCYGNTELSQASRMAVIKQTGSNGRCYGNTELSRASRMAVIKQTDSNGRCYGNKDVSQGNLKGHQLCFTQFREGV